MKLGPSFLKNTDPELAITASSECRCSILLNWQEIINDDWLLITIDKHANHVDASSIDLFCHEHVLNTVFEFGERTKRSQEVAIAKLTLVDIIWLDTIFKDVAWVVDLTGALPAE